MDPATFTFLRVSSGALILVLLVKARGFDGVMRAASFGGSVCLFAYAVLFSWAYVRIPAGVGAFVLFTFVQLTMVLAATKSGAGPRGLQWAGIVIALLGVGVLTLPGATTPDPWGVLLMATSGIAWGFYSLLGKRVETPLATTAASFIGAVPLALAALLLTASTPQSLRWDSYTIALSLASGGLASGVAYAIWYTALPEISATHAAVVQLAVPLLAASGGVMLLGEKPTIALAASAAAILAGIALAAAGPHGSPRQSDALPRLSRCAEESYE